MNIDVYDPVPQGQVSRLFYPDMFPTSFSDEKPASLWNTRLKHLGTPVEITPNLPIFHIQEDFSTDVPGRKRRAATVAAQTTQAVADNIVEENQDLLPPDEWTIKKVLTQSDVNHLHRLMIGKELVNNHMIPRFQKEFDAGWEIQVDNGRDIQVRDIDTDMHANHVLTFKKLRSSQSYVFEGKWKKDFVKRRGLEVGDEIGLKWATEEGFELEFSVLQKRAEALIA